MGAVVQVCIWNPLHHQLRELVGRATCDHSSLVLLLGSLFSHYYFPEGQTYVVHLLLFSCPMFHTITPSVSGANVSASGSHSLPSKDFVAREAKEGWVMSKGPSTWKLFCVWTHILHHLADCPHGSCKRTFLKPEIWKTLPLRSPVYSESAYFAYRWRHRPTPRPLAFDFLTLQHLITTTTTTMADYILVLQKILSLSGLRGQNILFLCHYAEQKRIMDNRIRHIVFFFLCSASPSTVCLFTARKLYVHAPSLLHFWWISSATYRPGIN